MHMHAIGDTNKRHPDKKEVAPNSRIINIHYLQFRSSIKFNREAQSLQNKIFNHSTRDPTRSQQDFQPFHKRPHKASFSLRLLILHYQTSFSFLPQTPIKTKRGHSPNHLQPFILILPSTFQARRWCFTESGYTH